MLEDELLDPPQVAHAYAAITGQTNDGLQPELALALRCADMDVRRFVSLMILCFGPFTSFPFWPQSNLAAQTGTSATKNATKIDNIASCANEHRRDHLRLQLNLCPR